MLGGKNSRAPMLVCHYPARKPGFLNIFRGGGLKFYRSANDVILCPGNEDGFLLPEYFEKIVEL